jgi:hypothetical protein
MFKTKSLSRGVVEIELSKTPAWVFLSSDWHWDSVKCDREKLEQDLRLAKELDAPVLAFGDVFDVMGGKFDPRGAKDELRPELLRGNYFDEVIEQCAEWLKPYSKQIAVISPGNHETAIRKRQETCLTTRLVERLKIAGSPVVQGGYSGWVLVKRRDSSKHVASHTIWYHHGYGGGGPVTRGVIDFSRFLVDIDADSIVAGHIHQRTLIESTRQRLTLHGIPRVRPIYLVRSASYKNECLTDGWAVEKGMSSRPLGGWWLRLTINRDNGELNASYHNHPE